MGREWYWHQNFFIDDPPHHVMKNREFCVKAPVHFGGDVAHYSDMKSLWFRREKPWEGEPSIWKTPVYSKGLV